MPRRHSRFVRIFGTIVFIVVTVLFAALWPVIAVAQTTTLSIEATAINGEPLAKGPSGKIVGSTRYHDIVADIGRVEIGYTWYSASYHGTHVNPACKLILMRHAFGTLGCGVVGLRTDDANLRSQRAIEKLGVHRDGSIRHSRRRKDDTISETVMYSLLRAEWPDVEVRLVERLSQLDVESSD